MSNVMAIALSGINSATQRFEASDFEANLKVIKTADEMMKKTLDILA
jgi:flagellar basal body rod protein FlgC